MQDIRFGDCRAVLQQFIDEGITAQMCVTSPPYYGLRDYKVQGQAGQESTPQQYVDGMVDTFGLVREVLTDDGTLWLNIGDTYATGTIAPRKRGSRGIGANTQSAQDAVPRCGTPEGCKTKDLIGIPWMLAFALRADGWYLRQDIIWHKPNPMPESANDRCTKSHEYLFLLSKSARYHFNSTAIREKASSAGRSPGGNHKNISTRNDNDRDMSIPVAETRNRRSVWSIATKPYKGAHCAAFPPALVEPCILAGSRVGDTVLDPFMGSGTTAQVALQHGRGYIGAELNTEYKPLQDARINSVTPAQVASQIPMEIAPQTTAESRA